jgi:hypothetical protein
VTLGPAGPFLLPEAPSLAGGISFPALLLGKGLNLPLQFIAGLSFGDSAAPRLLDQAARAFVFPLDTFDRISSTLTGFDIQI